MINKQKTLNNLKSLQDGIKWRSEDDEGANMYSLEIQSVIDSLNKSDLDIENSAIFVGLENSLVKE